MGAAFASTPYEEQDQQVGWKGVLLEEGEDFDSFLSVDVASRLHDEEGTKEFEACLRGIASTGFEQTSLEAILAAELAEQRSWAVGEALAEVHLEAEYGVSWPWNMERDKRNPKASLPGADLVGFVDEGNGVRLALGEVKTSKDAKSPPGVMDGRGGMIHQIDRLASDLTLIFQLLKWLHPRCKGTENQAPFSASLKLLFSSGNKAIVLFGVLIRDTQPNELDLKARAKKLSKLLQEPTTCHLTAIYLPCEIPDLPKRVEGGQS